MLHAKLVVIDIDWGSSPALEDVDNGFRNQRCLAIRSIQTKTRIGPRVLRSGAVVTDVVRGHTPLLDSKCLANSPPNTASCRADIAGVGRYEDTHAAALFHGYLKHSGTMCRFPLT